MWPIHSNGRYMCISRPGCVLSQCWLSAGCVLGKWCLSASWVLGCNCPTAGRATSFGKVSLSRWLPCWLPSAVREGLGFSGVVESILFPGFPCEHKMRNLVRKHLSVLCSGSEGAWRDECETGGHLGLLCLHLRAWGKLVGTSAWGYTWSAWFLD